MSANEYKKTTMALDRLWKAYAEQCASDLAEMTICKAHAEATGGDHIHWVMKMAAIYDEYLATIEILYPGNEHKRRVLEQWLDEKVEIEIFVKEDR